MSEEPKLPSLKLKPRSSLPTESTEPPTPSAESTPSLAGGASKWKLRSTSESLPPPPMPGVGPAEDTSGAELPRLRVKPRVAASPEPEPEAQPPILSELPPDEPVAVEPEPEPEPEPAPAAEPAFVETPSPEILPELPETPAEPVEGEAVPDVPAPPSLEMIPPPPAPGSFAFSPEQAPPPPPRLTITPKAIPHIRASGDEEPQPSEAEVPPMHRRSFKIGVLVVVGVVALLLVVGALVVWKMLGSAESEAPVVQQKAAPVTPTAPAPAKPAAEPAPATPPPATPPPAGPTPSATLNEVAAMPKKAIDKARAVADQRSAQTREGEAEAAAMENPAPQPAPAAPAAPLPAKPEVVRSTPAPAPSVPAPVTEAPKASKAFKSFVSEAKISGVFQGDPPRALINGRTLRAGDLVNKDLGVYFESIDVSTRTITFVDDAGARVSRRY